jgi:Flp pilus assembly protein TadG
MTMTINLSFRRDNRGQTLVEFALASIVLLSTIFGTLEFGIAVWRYNMVADLAQEGARWASVRGANSGGGGASAAQVQAYVQSRAPGFDVTVTTTPAPSTLNAGETVTVVVQSTYTSLTRLVPQGLLTMSSTAKMIVSR